MTTPSHETWQDEPQREPRTIVDAFHLGSEEKSADQERRDEDYLDTARGLWGPTE
jgi:hypothetical protein